MRRIQQLDSLRAIAVILVVLHHTPLAVNELFLNEHPLGANLFMVLSGYLITAILLHEQQKAKEAGVTRGTVFRNFIIKRALRIFPLYFLFLIATALVTEVNAKFLLSLATFTANFYIWWKQDWMYLSHTWSLSVQEHFYFFWPLVVLFSPKRLVLPLILLFAVLGTLCQQILFLGEFGALLTPSCFDALGGGALLAWLFADGRVNKEKMFRWLGLCAGICLLIIVFSFIYRFPLFLPFRTLYTPVVMWLIAYIVYWGDKGILNKPYLLGNPVLHFIGRISFGLYLLHPVLPNLADSLFLWLNDQVPAGLAAYRKYLLVVEENLLLVAVSYLTYRFIEMPFLRLKQKFSLADRKGAFSVIARKPE